MTKRPLTKLLGKIQVKHGFPFKGEHFESSGRYVVLTPGNFYEGGGFKRNQEKDKCYSESFPEEYLLKKGDFVIAMTEQADGLLGSMAKIPESDRFLHNQRLGLVTSLSSDVDVAFLYHLFKTKSVRLQIRRSASGSKVKHTSPERIYDLQVPLPSRREQSAVAKLLSSLDDKIDLNKQINKQLKGMAKLLYDYWFVQFDFPITAAQAAAMGKPKLEGKPYRASGGKMVYDATLKHEIPAGWMACELSNIISRSATGLNPRENFKLGTGNNYYVTIKNIEDGEIVLNDKCDKIDDEALSIIDRRAQLQPGDVLFTSIEPVGVTYLIHEKPKNWNINESVFTIRPDYNKTSPEHLYFLLSSSQMKSFTKNSSSGSIHKGIRHGVLKTFKLAYGSKALIDDFSRLTAPALKRIDLLSKENQQLTQHRDWLLPMLMNGQVTVN
ncbi:MAG: restriction endonuclease subunit S [Elusimicrobiota bacterium]|jgi:type I restriction enzyme S subunit